MRNDSLRPVTYPLHAVTRVRRVGWRTCQRLLATVISRFRAEQGGDIGWDGRWVAHQGLANEDGASAGAAEKLDIGPAVNAAFGHKHAALAFAGGELGGQLGGEGEVNGEGVEVAIVDADQVRPE